MDFIKWSARYGKNRFYKILLYFILFIIATFFVQSCKTHAATIDTVVTANSYYQTQYCEQGQTITDTYNNSTRTGNRFTCTKGPSYKFSQYLNNTENTSVPALITSGQLFNNFTFEITFPEQLQIITSTDRYIELRAPWVSSNTSNSTIGVLNTYLTLNGIVNNTTKNYTPSVSVFFNQPQYCSWVDNTGAVSYCNVHIAADTSISRYTYYIDIPVGSSVKSITLFFGNNNIQSTYDLYTDTIPTTSSTFRAMTPTIFGWGSGYCNSDTTSYNCYAISYNNLRDFSSNNYNIYGSQFYSGAGLIYYAYSPDNPTFTPSNQSQNIWFSNSLSSNRITYNFSSTTQENQDYYNNLVGNIENEVNPGTGDTWFDDSLNGFTDSDEANSFITLFNSLISYPLQKFQQQNSEKLTWTNINGTELLSDHICRGSGIAGDFGSGIQLSWHGATFNFPCIHKDIYAKLSSDSYAFYPPTLNGAIIVGGNNNNFYSIIKIIIDGFLIYYMFISCIDIYKYILDSDRKEIEVLDL